MEKARTAFSGVSWQAMPAASKIARACCTACAPSQQACSRPGAARSSGPSSATRARAMSALGTMAVGACMKSTVPLPGACSRVRRVWT